MDKLLKKLQKRILEISYKHNLSHLGSCFSTLPILLEIYSKKKEDDVFILSNGHAGLALYVVLEHYYGNDAESMLEEFGIHPFHSPKDRIYCSGGSLGQGLTVGVGYAIANPNKTVYVVISDGECSEGCIWESLRYLHERPINNIEIHANINGVSAINYVDVDYLTKCLTTFYPKINIHYTTVEAFDFLKGLEAHYKVMSEENYKSAINQLL